MSEMTLYVGGMGCRRCVREVTARLRDVSGVQTVVADSATSTVRLGGLHGCRGRARRLHRDDLPPRLRLNSATTATGQWPL